MLRNDNVFDREGQNDLHWTAMLYHGGKFFMFYNYGMVQTGPTPQMVGMAFSEDGLKFRIRSDVVLYPSMGAWDSQLIEAHSIIRAGGVWRMYYCGYDGTWRIGMAESEDLFEWKKHVLPILDIGDAQWENKLVADPCVIYFKGRYLMYYMGKGKVWQVGLAMSRDGMEWSKYIFNPIMKAEEEWCDGCIVLSGIAHYKGGLLAAVHGYNKAEDKFRTKLFWSENGIKWKPTNVTMEPGEWNDRGIVHPEPIIMEDKVIIYYTGVRRGNPNQHRIGRAVLDLKELEI